MGNTYNRVYIWCCKYGENCYCERCANIKLCASKHTGLLNSCLGKLCLHPYLVVPLISARVTLISTRVSAHCHAILLGAAYLSRSLYTFNRHRCHQDFWAFTRLKMGFGLFLLISNMIIQHEFYPSYSFFYQQLSEDSKFCGVLWQSFEKLESFWGGRFSDSLMQWLCRDNFLYAPSQWETTLQYNVVSHWLSAYTKWSPIMRWMLQPLTNKHTDRTRKKHKWQHTVHQYHYEKHLECICVTSTLTHCIHGDGGVISKVQFSNSFYKLTKWALPVKLLSGECHKTPLMIS